MAGLSLAGCNGDYDDWASPQSYSQESTAAKYGISFAAGPEANDNGEDANTFTGYMYLDQKGFKFYNWDSSVIATNNTVSQDGYYKVSINLSTKQTTCTLISRIGIIGDATADGWNADQPMTYNKAERCWELNDVTMKAGTFKFRANNGWDINWGGTADALTQGGDNINIDAGTYDIKLYAWADGKAYCTLTKK